MIRYCAVVLLLLISATFVSAEEDAPGKITGIWATPKGGPIADALVYVFNADSGPPPLPEKYWRVPDGMGMTNDKGRFSLDVGAGTYYLGTLKKVKGNEPGPPADGDLFFFSRDTKGEPKKYQVSSGATLDVGTLPKAAPFKVPSVNATKGLTAITGSIKEKDGTPVPGVMVVAYLNPQMSGRPLFVSFRTGKDGKYLLQLDAEGTYYLKIRELYGGGRPKSGDIYGLFTDPVFVKHKTVVKNVDIVVERFVDKRPTEQ